MPDASPYSRNPMRWRRWLLVALGVAIVALVVVVAVTVIPILTHTPRGSSGQAFPVSGWPTAVTAVGDDGRERTLYAEREDGAVLDTASLRAGDRVVVRGTGYDAATGIYVAICKVPDDPAQKPSPCLGGIPEGTEAEAAWGPSNWINDNPAWRALGARPYDDAEVGRFTASLQVPPAAEESLDCTQVRCGIYTRSDHTASADRVQDLYLPVAYAAEQS